MTFKGFLKHFWTIVKQIGIKSVYVIAIYFVLDVILWVIFLCVSLIKFKRKTHTISTEVNVNKLDVKKLEELGIHLKKRKIGTGYYGSVYKAYRTSSVTQKMESIVVKVIDVKKYHNILMEVNAIDEKSLDLAFNESLNSFKTIENERIVKIEVKYFNELQKLFLFSNTAEMNLNDFLSQRMPNGLDEEWARIWFRQLSEAVNCLHTVYKITHQNIKPENILLFSKTNNINEKISFDLKLSDTGIVALFPNFPKVCTKMNPICVLSSMERPSKNSTSNDIYNLGLILLILLRTDINQLVFNNKPFGLFANFNDRHIEQIEIDSVKQLLKEMLNRLPHSRPDITRVLEHRWLNPKIKLTEI